MENSNGRLFRAYRSVGRRLAGAVRGLSAALLVIVVGTVARVAPVEASSNASFDTAMAYCQRTIVGRSGWFCDVRPNSSGSGGKVYEVEPYAGGNVDHQSWSYVGVAPSVCSQRPQIVYAGDLGTQYINAGCVYAPFGDENHTVCIDASGEHYCTGSSLMMPTGEGDPNAPPDADPLPPPPKVCGGGSCYDPCSGNYCAMAGSQQVCVPAPSAGSGGGCASSGDTTLCAGGPPPLPPASAVPDPATDIAGSDTYHDTTGAGSPSSSTTNVTVNNYNSSGGAAQSGASSGDVGPPQPDPPTDDGDKTSASGGGNCGTPPVVEGNAALAMVARQVWLARCQGDGGQSNDSDTTVPGLDGIGESPGPGFITEGTLLDKLDGGGFGGASQCPSLPELHLDAYGVDSDPTPDWWCGMLEKLSYLIVALGAFSALCILGAFKR